MTKPFVSVIMPVRNEGAFIEQALSHVLQQDYPEDYVIATGETHRVWEMAKLASTE